MVYYSFSHSIDSATQAIIMGAIAEIENKTCLRFQERASNDRIEFTGEGDGCSTTGVGKREGKQLIRLPATSKITCRTHRIVLHLVCHALGMWHEHTRPDRDLYVEILKENVDPDDLLRNFNRRKEFEINNYGQTVYDYASIMHFGKDYFSNNGEDTLSIANAPEYNCQGEPALGQRASLSTNDAIKLNQMYNCPGSGYGVPGHLKVHIRHGIALNLKSSTTYSNYMYVQVIAVDNNGKYSTYTTDAKVIMQWAEETEWNQWINFGARVLWQYLVMSLWVRHSKLDGYPANQLMSNQTFTVSQGSYRNLQYCDGQSCSSRIDFDYDLAPDRNDCNPDKCVHGTCTDQFFAFTCSCPKGYSGLYCEKIRGLLRVYIRRGHNLPNEHARNAYASVEAYSHNSSSYVTLKTQIVKNTHNPQWNEWLDFGENTWSRICVTIYDKNLRNLLCTTYYYFPAHDSKEKIRMPCNTGYVELDYSFQP